MKKRQIDPEPEQVADRRLKEPKTIALSPPSNVTTLAGLEGWISTQLAKRGIPARRVGGILQANASSLQQFIETPAGKDVLLAMV